MYAGLAAVALCAVLVRVLLLANCAPSEFWDSGSYLLRAHALASGSLPRYGMRMLGYPVFLLLTGGLSVNEQSVVVAQVALGVASNCLVFLLVWRLTRSTWLAIIAGLISMTYLDLVFMEVTLYSETLTLFLLNLGAFLAVASWRSKVRLAVPTLAGLSFAAAALVRPIAAVAVMVIAIAFAVRAWRDPDRRRHHRRVVLSALIPVLVLLAFNLARFRVFGLATGTGFSLVNYVGFPELYERLPDSSPYKAFYVRAAPKFPNGPVPRDELLKPLFDSMGVTSAPESQRDRIALRIGLEAIANAPDAYLRVWMRTLYEFSSEFPVVAGRYLRPEMAEVGTSQISPGQETWVVPVERLWHRRIGVISAAAFLLPLLVFGFVPRRREDRADSRGALLVVAVVITLFVVTSTMIEPWPGQGRYRMPVQELQLVVAVSAAAVLARALVRAVARGTSGERGTRPARRDPVAQ